MEVTMTPEQIEELGPAFADYLQPFLYCCGDHVILPGVDAGLRRLPAAVPVLL
jgi:hypothetical protein